jgi:signal transduction histidine kinase
MSAAGSQLALTASSAVPQKHRSALAQLLHALNQPLTGLQCSLELAVAQTRPPEQYVRTLHESLELTLRMRLLVEAIRELTDIQQKNAKECGTFQLDALLRETVEDLRPVAASRGVHLIVAPEPPLPVYGDRSHMAQLVFRVLESALSLTRLDGEFRITARREREHAVVDLAWSEAPPPVLSPFSRAELGLLVARAAWEDVGAHWASVQAGNTQACTIRLALASSTEQSPAPV